VKNIITVFVIVCLAAGCVFSIWRHERNTLANARDQLQRYTRFLAPPLSNLDQSTAQEYIDLTRGRGFAPASVVFPDGRTFVTMQVGEDASYIDNFLRGIGLIRGVPLSSRITYRGQYIGDIHGVWINRNIYTYFNVSLVLLLVLALFLLAGFFRRVAREREEAQEELSETRERLDNVVAGAPIILFAVDATGIFALCRGKGLDKLGREPGELDGCSVFDIYKAVPGVVEDFQRAFKGETFTSVRTVGGLVFESWYSPFLDEANNVARVIGVWTDITALQRAMDELAERDENMRLELSLARKIQRAMLPGELPSVPGLELGLLFIPSGDIGGDFVDFIHFDGTDKLGVVFADITGHGVPAALLSAMFKVLIDDVLHSKLPLSECFSILNGRLSKEFPRGNFASTFYAVFNSSARTMNYVKASQEPALLFRRGESVRVLKTGGPVLGIMDPKLFPKLAYQENTVELKLGDTIFFFTDGLVELASPNGKMLEQADLINWIEEDIALEPQALVERIYARSIEFAGASNLPDDVAALAVRLSG
jgi:serine phosphatase RsbU (regulator of sigma subunit)/PAS domain-containing protein